MRAFNLPSEGAPRFVSSPFGPKPRLPLSPQLLVLSRGFGTTPLRCDDAASVTRPRAYSRLELGALFSAEALTPAAHFIACAL
ncbi:MAG TPA: hypothetical protein DIC31_00775 [Rhizobiales bacterium]|nr:hypothetical protein [Hyphomicrobiales bacterium]HCL61008.1 hypothetical protein [Hyphomicrobiales bacterium]